MKLPVLDTYAFPVTIPSTQKDITLRPYLVREEKLLLMAQESNSYDEQCEAIAQVIRNCSDRQVEPRVAPYFDIEYLLLQLRARSVGEIASPVFKCENTRDGRPCGHLTPISINLSTITVGDIPPAEDRKIVLSPRYTLRLKYPTIYTVNELLVSSLNDSAPRTERAINSMIDLFDTLEDSVEKTTYNFADYSEQDKLEFLEQLPPSDYAKLTEFLEHMPAVTHTVQFTCSACAYEHTITLKGVADFLA